MQSNIGRHLLVDGHAALARPSLDDLSLCVNETIGRFREREDSDRGPECLKELICVLWQWAWRGDVEQVVEFLEAINVTESWPGVTQAAHKAQGIESVHAALLLFLGRSERAEAVVEGLQQSKLVAAKVLCAAVTFGWNEHETAVDMLFKVLSSLSVQQFGQDPHSTEVPQQQEPLLDLFGEPLDAPAIERWRTRVTALLISSYAASGDYSQAMDLCSIRAGLQDATSSSKTSIGPSATPAGRRAALLQLARLRLQIGDVEAAKSLASDIKNFNLAEEPCDRDARRLLEGLLDYASGNYFAAAKIFETMLSELPPESSVAESAQSLLISQDDNIIANIVDGIFTAECSLRVTLSNNLALCYFNCCELSRAIATLENCIVSNPKRNINRALVFNLCTLYDFAKPKEQSLSCKQDLQTVVQVLGIQGRFNDSRDFLL